MATPSAIITIPSVSCILYYVLFFFLLFDFLRGNVMQSMLPLMIDHINFTQNEDFLVLEERP